MISHSSIKFTALKRSKKCHNKVSLFSPREAKGNKFSVENCFKVMMGLHENIFMENNYAKSNILNSILVKKYVSNKKYLYYILCWAVKQNAYQTHETLPK